MNRRTFIHATLGLTGGLGLAEADTPVGSLLKMLEDSPREQVPREARTAHPGRRALRGSARSPLPGHRQKRSALPGCGLQIPHRHDVAGHRRRDSTPAPGRSAGSRSSGRRTISRRASRRSKPRAAGVNRRGLPFPRAMRQAVRRSLDERARSLGSRCRRCGDREVLGRSLRRKRFSRCCLPTVLRDLRQSGTRRFPSAMPTLLTGLLGSAHAEPLLRSTVAALLNSDEDPDPATHDLSPDRPWRENEKRLSQIPASWDRDTTTRVREHTCARLSIRQLAERAGAVVVELLRRGVSPEAHLAGPV